ncbi:MAG: UPF0182 family protein [Gemmatimonadota bacterium]
MSGRRWPLLAILTVAILLVAGRVITGWYVDYRWYQSLGAADVWWSRAGNLMLLRGGAFAAAATLAFANFYAVRHSVLSVVFPRKVGNIEIREELSPRLLLGAVLSVSLLVGFILALTLDGWTHLDLVRHGEVFRESDPYFQLDLSFWVYWLPLEIDLHRWALVSLITISLMVVVFYALTPSLRWEGGKLRTSGYVRRHFFTLGALVLLLLGWSYRLDAYNLLLEGSGEGGAVTSLDHRVAIPTLLFLALATAVGAMLFAWSGWIGQLRLAAFTLAALLILSIGLRQIVPPLATRVGTTGNADPEARERPYLATRTAFTRRAYDVNSIGTLTDGDSTSIRSALMGASIWDPEVLARLIPASRQGQRGIPALGWNAGGERLVVAAVERPVGPDAADAEAPWSARHIQAGTSSETGGLVLDDEASETSARLLPALVAEDAPGYAIVMDSAGVIAASGISSLRSRVAHAWALQNPGILGDGGIGRGSKAVLIRQLRPRIRRLFPGFTLDSRTRPVILGDSVYWAVHLYSAASTYPLSEPAALPSIDLRYIRHAGVAIVNSHTGRAFAIATRDPDPLARSWMRHFPSLFVSSESLPEELLTQIQPPLDLALVQARVLGSFGRRGEQPPRSRLIRQHGGDTLFAFPANTPHANLASGRLELALPIVDPNDRVRGAYIARGAGGGGALLEPAFVELPTAGPRWGGVLERLRRALDSAAAGDRRSSDVALIRGPARVVPAGRELVFMQTLYRRRGSAPDEVVAVAVLQRDSIGVGQSAPAAAGFPEPMLAVGPLDHEGFRARVAAIYSAMRDALERGDLAAFGEAWENLGRVLRAQRPP